MAVINANCLAIYYDSQNSQSKATVLGPYANISEYEGTSPGATSNIILADDDASSGERNIFTGYGSTDELNLWSEYALTLAGAATTSSVDLSNTVDNVARDGSGGVLQQATQEWSLTADGLIESSNDAGESLMDLARNKYYVFVKFSIDKNGVATDYVGQGIIDSVTLSGGVDEIATYSVSITGVDALFKA